MAKDKVIKLDNEDISVLSDYQLAINHLNEAMGRYLGHIGVKKHGLKKGGSYSFDMNWAEDSVTISEVKKKLD